MKIIKKITIDTCMDNNSTKLDITIEDSGYVFMCVEPAGNVVQLGRTELHDLLEFINDTLEI